MNSKYLINLAIKYHGNYDKIFKAVKNKEVTEIIYDDVLAFTILDDCYPSELLDLKKPPLVLFYRGNLNLLSKDKIAIVGSRMPSDYAKKVTKDLIVSLDKKKVTVSGLAKGIDAIVHENSLDRTIAVLGCGIDYVYPKCNKILYKMIEDQGLIISEYPFDEKPQKYYFPFRNRIVAALSTKIIVTAASCNSGTMITVNEGLELNRDIYTFPYSIYDKNGEGCNNLIQQGANLILFDDLKNL